MPEHISYAQNGEDVRIWHAFGPRFVDDANQHEFRYVDVGANDPRTFSLTAALYDLGWRGLLVEADPLLAQRLRDGRPEDIVVEAAAAANEGLLTFYRVPGTGLGTLDASEAAVAEERGFHVIAIEVPALRLDAIASGRFEVIHVLSIDVEGAEAQVLAGLSLRSIRPWVMCIESVEPGTNTPSHENWEPALLKERYRFVAFDGINRWYVAEEHADQLVNANAGAPEGTTIAQAIATPFHVLDIGQHGWVNAETAHLLERDNRAYNRFAWQRELIMNDLRRQVPSRDYLNQIHELRAALVQIQGSRTFDLSRRISALAKRGVWLAHRMKSALPTRINAWLIKQRHLRHVTVNMQHLTDPAYLGKPAADDVLWLADGDAGHSSSSPRPPIPPGLDLRRFTDADQVRAWLEKYPWDSDSELESRLDNHGDEVGRVRAALRTRLKIANPPASKSWAGGNRIAFDARSLQTPAFGNRGIGRFASAALIGAREAVEDERITLIVDKGLPPLPEDLAGNCAQVTKISEREAAAFSVLIQPSPMTHTADPLIPILHSRAYTLAVVFDFIPMHDPTVYLSHPAARAEYATNLDALRLYKDFVCISKVTRRELATFLGVPENGPQAFQAVVAWPRNIALAPNEVRKHKPKGDQPIVIVSGDEPRKNTFGGLAGIAAATSHVPERDVIVIGMTGHENRVHHWSIAAAMRPGEARVAHRMSDSELLDILAQATCVVVPSFDEGLSLPVIEAVEAGTPVVASNIPSHRELIGGGKFMCNPTDPRSIARAVRRTRGRQRIARIQRRKLMKHKHASLEAVVAKRILDNVRPAEVAPSAVVQGANRSAMRLNVGVLTPWQPQRTGVGDFSTTIFTQLARHADVTVYTTADGVVNAGITPHHPIEHRNLNEVLDQPDVVQQRHDVIISVVGNSHFHLPFIEALGSIESVVVAHDTRMVEYYMALRGKGGVEQIMLTTASRTSFRTLQPNLDQQIDDMRLLQNAGFWEIANRSKRLIVHSQSAAPRISDETGIPVYVLPFANQRTPDNDRIGDGDRIAARQRLGLADYPSDVIHLGSFGYVDPRTKMTDVVLEAAAWLTQWGRRVALHLIGSATDHMEHEFTERARNAGIEFFQITGFQDEQNFRDWLLGIDLGIQLRVSPRLGVSGPLSDLAAFGTPAVASQGLCVDVDTPAYIHRLPDAVSAVMVAEAIERVLSQPQSVREREAMRTAYLASKTPEIYVNMLMDVIREVSQ